VIHSDPRRWPGNRSGPGRPTGTSVNIPLPEQLDQAGVLSLLARPIFRPVTKRISRRVAASGWRWSKTTVSELAAPLRSKQTPGQGYTIHASTPPDTFDRGYADRRVGDHTCAVPQAFVEEIVLISEKSITTIKQVETTPYRERLASARPATLAFPRRTFQANESPVLVVSSDRGRPGSS